MYFRIGYLFTWSCSDYLKFQGSAKKWEKSSESTAKDVFYWREKKKSKLQNPLSRTEIRQNPTVQSLNVWEKTQSTPVQHSTTAIHQLVLCHSAE